MNLFIISSRLNESKATNNSFKLFRSSGFFFFFLGIKTPFDCEAVKATELRSERKPHRGCGELQRTASASLQCSEL